MHILPGLHDYSPLLALHTVLDFWEAITPSAVRKYIQVLLKDASEYIFIV